MSVEKEGPRGYEYQYLVSVLIGLNFIHKDNVKIYIESENGEDLQVQFEENRKIYTIDIQVKKRNQKIDMEEFTKWISHFDKNSNNINLFTKLESSPDRFVLYITNSRCLDEISSFVENDVIINRPLKGSISKELIEKIKFNTLSNFSSTTKLSKNRHDFLKKYFSQTKVNDFRMILKKNKIWDSQSPDNIRDEISRILNKEYFVPQSKIESTLLELIEIVKQGRDLEHSITSKIVELLKEYKGTRIFTYNNTNVSRLEKEYCRESLSRKNVLLLSGVSFCGKTYLARELAQEYQDLGYTVKITNEILGDNGGFSFLRHNSHEDRLLILEDPFGQIITNEKALEILSNVKKLIDHCDSHRKIIITTRKDILLHTMQKNTLNECALNIHTWYDLTLEDINIGKELWQVYFGETDESLNLFNRVRDWLRKNEKVEFIQPGQLSHLYNSQYSISDFAKMEVTEILKIARIDSEYLANKIENRGNICKLLYISLGLCCNTYKSVHLNHLSYVLSDLNVYPSIIKNNSFPSVEIKEVHSTYSENIQISQEYLEELKYLKRHGYIQIDNLSKTLVFSHPIYHYASKILFQTNFEDIFESEVVINIAKKSLACLSKGANLCSLMMLETYYEEKKNQIIKEMMLESLSSIYPSVRDRVVMFFDNRINELNEEEANLIINSIRMLSLIDDELLLWKDGDPYFNYNKKRKYTGIKSYDIKRILKISEKFTANEVLTSEEMWLFLNYGNKLDGFSITKEIVLKAMTYDEVFIREKAIFYLFENFAFEFDNLEEYLDYHEHPNVIYKLFRGALNNWKKYNPSLKHEILDFYKRTLNIVTVSIRSLNFLENFNNQYKNDGIVWTDLNNDEIKELWSVWHEVFIELLDKFPSKYINMKEPHMVEVTGASLKYVNEEEKIVKLAWSWMNWLNNYSKYYIPAPNGMSVATYLMEGTKECFELRKEVFSGLISTKKTSFITTNIQSFIDHWNFLSNNEKASIIKLLQSERKDLNWLKAVALTRNEVPEEVQLTIIGEILFIKNSNEIIKTLNRLNLLENCINVFCGFPQPLWWNSYHHKNFQRWDEIILNILTNNDYNMSFTLSLKEFIDALYNHQNNRFKHGYYIFEQMLNDVDKRKLIFDRLLFETIKQNQDNKKLWDLLFEKSTFNEREYYIGEITKYIEAVQYYHTNYKDLFCIFDKNVIFNEIYPKLENDFKIYEFCMSQINLFNQNRISGNTLNRQRLVGLFKIFIKTSYEIAPPRLSLTNKLVINLMKELNIRDKTIENILKRVDIEQTKIREKMVEDFKDEYELENWIN